MSVEKAYIARTNNKIFQLKDDDICLSVDKSQLKTAARKSQTTVSLTYLVNLNGTEGALSEYLATRVDWGSRDICVIVSDGKDGGSGQRGFHQLLKTDLLMSVEQCGDPALLVAPPEKDEDLASVL